MTKCRKGIIGSPKFRQGDLIKFDYLNAEGEIELHIGEVAVVDSYGTFEQGEEPSYDVWTELLHNGKWIEILVKHVVESQCYEKGVWQHD